MNFPHNPERSWKTHLLSIRCLLLCALFIPIAAQAQERVLAEIRNISPRELRTDGFVLDKDQEVRLTAVVPEGRKGQMDMGTAWILDARTREVIWTFDDADTRREGDVAREAEEGLFLKAGSYEVYYASYPNWYGSERWEDTNNLGDVIRNVMDEIFDRKAWGDWKEVYHKEAERFHITVEGRDGQREGNLGRLAEAFQETAFLSLNQLRNDEHLEQGFILKRDMSIDVYAMGEMMGDEGYDYGWIINAETRKPVWKMNADNTEHAGGAYKNRVANQRLDLAEGKYVAFFITDDSHSYRSWNAGPPFDPNAWGISLFASNPYMNKYVALYEYEDVPLRNAIVSMRRLDSDAHRTEGFTLKKPMKVRIYAVGEGRDGELYDYGWIMDADTRERVWTMTYDYTEHAGGTPKNRMFDDVIALPAGNYVAHFITDDSHAYDDFNAAAPYHPEAWGMTIVPAGTDYRASDIKAFDEQEDAADVLAQIIRVRDDAYEQQTFTLRESAKVRVYALGEGDEDEMYDYGWIEDANGDVFWEMTYRMTEHAGGGDKNRLLNRVIYLAPGTYTLYYKSDGSHAFGDWNDDQPSDPSYWGITLKME